MFYDLSLVSLVLLFLALFFAGFVDAIAGGGGLIQTPALLLAFPNENPVSVVGTSKTAAFFGTATAAIKYRRSIKTDTRLLLAMVLPAFIGSAIGALLASKISASSFKSSIFIMMIIIFIYTWRKPELGKVELDKHSPRKLKVIGGGAAALIGFYLASMIVVGLNVGIMWKLGIALGLANLVGGYLGSHLAINKGSSFIRIFYLIVTGLLIARLGYSIYFQ